MFSTDAFCKENLLHIQWSQNKVGGKSGSHVTAGDSQAGSARNGIKATVDIKEYVKTDSLANVSKQHNEVKEFFPSEERAAAFGCKDLCSKSPPVVAASKISVETLKCMNKSSSEVSQSGSQDSAAAVQVHPCAYEGVLEMMHHLPKSKPSLVSERADAAGRQHERQNLNKIQSGYLQGEMAGKVGIPHERRSGRQATEGNVPDVIVIEDDDEDDEDGHGHAVDWVEHCDVDFDSDDGPTADSSSASASELSDSSDQEDCLVMEPGPSRMSYHSQKRVYGADKRPAYNLFDSSEMSSSSDCEIIEDPNGKVRQDWEEAALRKRVGNALNAHKYRAESEGSTSASNHASSHVKRSANGKQKGYGPKNDFTAQKRSKSCQSGPSIPVPVVDSNSQEDTEAVPVALNQQDSNHYCPDARLQGATTLAGAETSSAENLSSSLDNDAESSDERANGFLSNTVVEGNLCGSKSPQLEACDVPPLVGDNMPERKNVDTIVNPMVDGNLVVDRERLKQTEEFQHAIEEEWARRQLELQRQAHEAQRERKRRKAEAERRMEMEIRQRQRLEEIRQSQKKEEQDLGYKEQVRGRIRSELERVAATCVDMATLLRRLGIQVEGGSFPTTQQVNAAYKKALLRFHPDRVAAVAISNPSHQVEAEETFKLISRMKSILQPVAAGKFS